MRRSREARGHPCEIYEHVKKIWKIRKIGVLSKLNTFNLLKKERFMAILICYAMYLTVSLALTVWVARTLHKNGRVFLVEAFRGNTELADSVNHLLVVGFYLINIGYIALALAFLHHTRWVVRVCRAV